MSGIFLNRKGSYIEKVLSNKTQLSLLANSGQTEIMLQKIDKNTIFFVYPADSSELMEFFYILEGELVLEFDGEMIKLKNGDYYFSKDLENKAFFKTITDVQILYVSDKPVFHLISNKMKDLEDMRNAVEEKDMYTHAHGERVKEYSVKIGEKLLLSNAKITCLNYAAAFHDLGKINVPDEVLKKPGRLTTEEFEYIKKHPKDGEDIVKDTFIKESALGIGQHHERLDGSGYPLGLKGDEICLEAKIIGVADSYDAMTSDRPYRKGMEPGDALRELKALVGKHYDELIISKLEEVLKEEGLI
ncbi:HD-GYP domain-containing protein [Clostridium folliculivorans]|uniref:Phosphohydrolase n=1 Tax=Clostridium folliculivorans TaxID=2886038 RepID=A0A9W5Y3Q1_9CLOT|nr:HD domain-containing phosphohydrolase [Clostridium folliculivorans]GKU25970.1 phosphohydrolase [Clostridium folliculivorans]GKU28056.1 phosphohydrolase [Clostridium folliculivorans]